MLFAWNSGHAEISSDFLRVQVFSGESPPVCERRNAPPSKSTKRVNNALIYPRAPERPLKCISPFLLQEVLHAITANTGQVQRIVIFKKNGVQAMIEYPLLYTRTLSRFGPSRARDNRSVTNIFGSLRLHRSRKSTV